MPAANPLSRGRDLAQRLMRAADELRRAPRPGARSLPKVTGLTPQFISTVPYENVLADTVRILVESRKVFVKGDDVVYESVVGQERRLITLCQGETVDRAAHAILGNLFLLEHAEPDRDPVQFPPQRSFVSLLLNSEPTRLALEKIKALFTRPAFDNDFNLLSPGWHPASGIMVHGPEVEPILYPPEPGLQVQDRLPPRLRQLLGGYCFRGPEDVIAAVAALLTGLLASHFIVTGKAMILIDGNQPGLGKTLLARILGIILDGVDPGLIHYTSNDEELSKEICSRIRGGRSSVIIVDNAKLRAGGVISSPVLESVSMAPRITIRILGQSVVTDVPNDRLWILTMNDTKTSPDLVSRAMPIRLNYAGNPTQRNFTGVPPIAFATEHRVELLGELCGMVVRWDQAGRPDGSRQHRCDQWAKIIGGILEVASLSEFLGNLDEAAASFNQALDELSGLAEKAYLEEIRAILPRDLPIQTSPPEGGNRRPKRPVAGLLPGELEPLFRKAGVAIEKLDIAKSQQAKSTVIGSFLTVNVDREIPVAIRGHAGRARLVAVAAGHNQKRYGFVFTWENGSGPPPQEASGGMSAFDRSELRRREPHDRPRPTARPFRAPADPDPDDLE